MARGKPRLMWRRGGGWVTYKFVERLRVHKYNSQTSITTVRPAKYRRARTYRRALNVLLSYVCSAFVLFLPKFHVHACVFRVSIFETINKKIPYTNVVRHGAPPRTIKRQIIFFDYLRHPIAFLRYKYTRYEYANACVMLWSNIVLRITSCTRCECSLPRAVFERKLLTKSISDYLPKSL